MSNTTIHVHLIVTVPASNAQDFETLMSELVERAQDEPGTLIYE